MVRELLWHFQLSADAGETASTDAPTTVALTSATDMAFLPADDRGEGDVRRRFSLTFDSAGFRLYLKRADAGADTVLVKKNFDIQAKPAAMNGSGNGSWTSSTIKKKVGSKSAYGDGALRLNWDEDGKDVRHYGFKGTSSV